MLTSGQTGALRQLKRIASVEGSALRVDHVDKPSTANNWLKVDVSLDCTHYESREDGLSLHARESVRLWIHPDFPNEVPIVRTAHTRFLGFPHVQWGRQLCLYQSTETQWRPSQGMIGLITQLNDWFKKAAVNELDAAEGPVHPPVAYPSSDTSFCMQSNTPGRDRWPWFGAAELDWRKDNLYDVIDWKDIVDLPVDAMFAPAILLDFELPFEYPGTVFDLLRVMNAHGVETSRVLVHLMIAAQRASDDDALYVVIGAPSRGTAGDPDHRLQHLQVWEIEYVDVLKLKGVAIACDVMERYADEPTPEGVQALIDSVFENLVQWQKESRVRWCPVLENRPEVVTRRDADTPMDWFRNKTIALWGCGALGGQIAEQLVRAGVGELRLYDNDRVTPGVLVRQNFTDSDVNDDKPIALKRRLDAISPGIVVTAHPENITRTTLNSPECFDGLDAVIDATASLRVRSKLELVLKTANRRVPIVAMMVSGQARLGALVVTSEQFSGGPLDAFRRLGLAAMNRSWLSDCVDAFWGEREREPTRQPEPGCSDPTFVGSHADIGALASRMINRAATALQCGGRNAIGVLLRGETAKQPNAEFEFEPDIVVHGDSIEFRLTSNAWRDTQGWIRAGARLRSPEDETGGLMFGQFDELLGVAWISNVSGPPQDSEFSPEMFLCGTDGTDVLCKAYDKRSLGTTRYIGTWHSHPVSAATPSETDYLGIGAIFAMNPGDGAHQLMMIVGEASRAEPEIGLYAFEKQSMEHIGEGAEVHVSTDGGRVAAPELGTQKADIGLALSGGGSRAVAFHLGTLRALEDLGLLDQIGVLSGVSGGSLLTGLLGYSEDDFAVIDARIMSFLKRGLVWSTIAKLLHPKRLFQVVAAVFIVSLPTLILKFIVSFVRLSVAILPGNAKINAALSKVRWPIPRWYSRTHVMRDAVADLVGRQSCNAPTRQGKAVVFNACELRTTTAFRMSNKKYGSWRFGWSPASNLGVADAVTASAAFPPLLPPFDWKCDFSKDGRERTARVIITDGGVFENIGVSVMEPGRDPNISAISHPTRVIIASDASAGQYSGNDLPANWAARMAQSFNSVMRKVNDATKRRLHKQAEQGEIDGFVYVNLGQIDAQVPIKAPGWINREDVIDYPTNFSAMSAANMTALSCRGESITRSLISMYLLSD